MPVTMKTPRLVLAAILALGAHVPVRRPARLRRLLWVQFGLVATILGVSALGAAFPVLMPRVPTADSPAAAADHIAEQRMAAGSPTIWLPQR